MLSITKKQNGTKNHAETCFRCCGLMELVCADTGNMMYCTSCGYVPKSDSIRQPSTPLTCKPRIAKPVSSMASAHKKGALQLAEIEHLWFEHARVCDQTEKNLSIGLGEIIRLSISLSLKNQIALRAAAIFADAFVKQLTKGNSLKAIAAASLYAALRECSYGISVEQMARFCSAPRAQIYHCFDKLQCRLGLKVPQSSSLHFLPRMLQLAGIPSDSEVAKVALMLIQRREVSKLCQTRNHAGIAAAAVWLAGKRTGHRVTTQRELAGFAAMTEVTIRSNCAALATENSLSLSSELVVPNNIQRGTRKRNYPNRL